MTVEYVTPSKRWLELESKKETLHNRCEQYAEWTLPYIYPKTHGKDLELPDDLDSTGARAVNHLSNRIIGTLFPDYRPFLRLELSDDLRLQYTQSGIPSTSLDTVLINAEKACIRTLSEMNHKTVATTAVKLLIITGNSLLYYPQGGKSQVYTLRDYCVVRDLSGNVVEIITRDTKHIDTFDEKISNKIKGSEDYLNHIAKGGHRKELTIYTHCVLTKGRFKVTQTCLDIEVSKPVLFSKTDFPFIPLTWYLQRGEDYGRGMVEEYRGAFNAISVLSRAMIEGVIASATVKFLVDPASVVDVKNLNESPNGSYHIGRATDVSAILTNKHNDFQHAQIILEEYKRQISAVFLLTTGVTRSAERVTAEEIRLQAQELETAYGGIYSRFTEEWQKPLADKLLAINSIEVASKQIYPTIVTGLDTLTRAADTDNFRLFMQDLSMLVQVPENMQAYIKPAELITWLGNNRAVDYTKFLKTAEELQAEQQQQMDMQNQMQQQELMNQTTADTVKAAADSTFNGG